MTGHTPWSEIKHKSELEERLEAAEKAATGSAWGYWRTRAEAAEREVEKWIDLEDKMMERATGAEDRVRELEEALREIAEPFGDNDHAEHCLIHRRIAKHALNKT